MTTAEQLTLLGLLLAFGAAVVNWNYAKTANRHAAEALTLAKAADARADRLEAAARERRDIVWVAEWDNDENALVVRNTGTDTAYDVELIVDAAGIGERLVISDSAVAPTATVACDLTEANALAHTKWEEALNAGFFGTPHMGISARITWRSQSGVPGVHAFDDLRL